VPSSAHPHPSGGGCRDAGAAQSQETKFGAVLAGARSGFWGAMEKGVAQAGADLTGAQPESVSRLTGPDEKAA